MTITVWKDGTYKIWSDADALYAANDPDWLVNIPIDEKLRTVTSAEYVEAIEEFVKRD